MSRTRVKFCGITRLQDAEAAVQAGADAVGFVLVPRSPRHIPVAAVEAIKRHLPPFVHTVLLFKDATQSEVAMGIARVRPTLLQFHGDESAEFCASFNMPYIKAVPMQTAKDLPLWARVYASATGLLLDGHAPGELGGQGKTFDWAQVGAATGKPLVVAGGLTVENVGAAVRQMRPYAVDVSSGIESTPGVKDLQKMQRFIEEVQRADAG